MDNKEGSKELKIDDYKVLENLTTKWENDYKVGTFT